MKNVLRSLATVVVLVLVLAGLAYCQTQRGKSEEEVPTVVAAVETPTKPATPIPPTAEPTQVPTNTPSATPTTSPTATPNIVLDPCDEGEFGVSDYIKEFVATVPKKDPPGYEPGYVPDFYPTISEVDWYAVKMPNRLLGKPKTWSGVPYGELDEFAGTWLLPPFSVIQIYIGSYTSPDLLVEEIGPTYRVIDVETGQIPPDLILSEAVWNKLSKGLIETYGHDNQGPYLVGVRVLRCGG